MLRDEIRKDILETIDNLPARNATHSVAGGHLTIDQQDIEVSRTSDPRFGDFTTNVALRVAQAFGSEAQARRGKLPSVPNTKPFDKAQGKQSPMEFAKVLAQSLQKQPYLKKLQVLKPGFVNFFIKDEVWQKEVENVLKMAGKFGSNNMGKGKKARVEFVSANPTGPLHFGNARGGPIGDVLASVLEFCGYKAVREYLHNDAGEQVGKLGVSILNVAAGKPLKEQEYKGEYIREFADKITAQIRKKTRPTGITSPSLDLDKLGKEAVEKLLSEILADCEAMGIKFDEVYSESDFIDKGETKKILAELKDNGFLKEKDGALWFAPSDEFLKDRETVVVKSDQSYTYFANDIAYHNLKFADNPTLVIDVLGANHHGHVPRLQAVIKALGYDVSSFHVILYQWVRFRRDGEFVKMSKRSGTFVTVDEVLSEIGRDALRFFILMHDASSPIDFDLSLAREKSAKNPVYYVQYAHARICSILAKAGPVTTFPPASARSSQKSVVDKIDQVELRAVGSPSSRATRYKLLTTNYELELIKQISKLPELVEDIAGNFAVHRLTAYAIDLADSFHKFYENCRVIPARNASHSDAGGGEKEDLMEARIGLITATKIALANTLKLLGVSAPEKM